MFFDSDLHICSCGKEHHLPVHAYRVSAGTAREACNRSEARTFAAGMHSRDGRVPDGLSRDVRVVLSAAILRVKLPAGSFVDVVVATQPRMHAVSRDGMSPVRGVHR